MSHIVHAVFFFNDPATTEIYTLSLHDTLPIFLAGLVGPQLLHELALLLRLQARRVPDRPELPPLVEAEDEGAHGPRSEEHTSELQSRQYLACRLLLDKKNTSILLSANNFHFL